MRNYEQRYNVLNQANRASNKQPGTIYRAEQFYPPGWFGEGNEWIFWLLFTALVAGGTGFLTWFLVCGGRQKLMPASF